MALVALMVVPPMPWRELIGRERDEDWGRGVRTDLGSVGGGLASERGALRRLDRGPQEGGEATHRLKRVSGNNL